MSSFCQIVCRGVSHTPESVHVDKLAHLGVCNTPLHWLFADIHKTHKPNTHPCLRGRRLLRSCR